MMWYFSVRKSLHIFGEVFMGGGLSNIFHSILYSIPLVFRSQVWFLNSVLFEDLAWGLGLLFMDVLWTASLPVHVMDARPIYVSTWPQTTWVRVTYFSLMPQETIFQQKKCFVCRYLKLHIGKAYFESVPCQGIQRQPSGTIFLWNFYKFLTNR